MTIHFVVRMEKFVLDSKWCTFLFLTEESINMTETNTTDMYTEAYLPIPVQNTKTYVVHYPYCTDAYKTQPQ